MSSRTHLGELPRSRRQRLLRGSSLQFAIIVLQVCLLYTSFSAQPLLSQQPSEQAIVGHFQAGQQAIKSGQLELAVTEFTHVLRLSPNLPEAQVNLGLAYHLLGRYAESTAVLARAAAQQPELVPANLFLGLGYLKLGSHVKAVEPLERVVRLEPGNREARRALVACRLADSDYRDAAKEFQALFTLEPDKAEAWFQLGRDYTDASSRLVRRMSLGHRRTAWGHRLAGDLYSQTQRWEMAAQEYLDAIQVDAAQPGLHAELGRVYLHQQKPGEASAQFHSELERDPDEEQARLGLAELALAGGDVHTAQEQLAHLSRRSPEFPVVQSDFPGIDLGRELTQRLIAEVDGSPADGASHFLLAALFRITGDKEKAHEHQTAAERLRRNSEPERTPSGQEAPEELCRARRYAACAQRLESEARLDAAGYLLLGKARLSLRQFALASDAFAASIALAGDNAEVIYYLVRSYQVLANESFSRMEELAPDSWRTHQMRAEVYKLRYDDPQAIREYERAAQLRPDTPELYEELGALYLQNNARDKAQATLEKAVRLEPSRARALYLLGQMYGNAGEQERAILYLQKALRYDANLIEARATLGKAYMRAGRPAAAIAELQKALAFDFYGDLHYMLYRAYHDLGKTELARAALSRSAEMRKNSVARDRDKLERWMKN